MLLFAAGAMSDEVSDEVILDEDWLLMATE